MGQPVDPDYYARLTLARQLIHRTENNKLHQYLGVMRQWQVCGFFVIFVGMSLILVAF
jgi:hypothetical protein